MDILLVDDDVHCLASLEDLLEQDGHRTHTATRGREALGLARRLRSENRRFQLSILDVHVPDMTGLDTYRGLSSLWPDIGGIFITGDPSSDLEVSVSQVGGLALVRKPLDVCRMRALLTTYESGCRGR